MEGFISNLTPQRIIIIAGCVGIVVLWMRFKWKRTSSYVESRNELYSEHYKKLQEYAVRVRRDSRWPGLLSQIQSRYPVMDSGTPEDKETYVVHYCDIRDDLGRQFEPNDPDSKNAFIAAFLKRGAKPKYLRFQLSSSGELTEEKISGTSWYDMFEKSV